MFNTYFLNGLDELQVKVDDLVNVGMNSLGLGPLSGSLLPTDIFDLKTQVYDTLFEDFFFEDETEREEWIEITEGLNIAQALENKLPAANVDISCDFFNETSSEDSEENIVRFKVIVAVNGSAIVNDLDVSPTATFLPEGLESLDIVEPTIEVEYGLAFPLTLSLNLKKALIGEIEASLSAELSASVSKDLSILDSTRVAFTGDIGLGVELLYSSFNGFLSTGSFDASLLAEASTDYGTADLGLTADDANIFDEKPRKY